MDELKGRLITFFKSLCREVLGPYLTIQGFSYIEFLRETVVVYENAGQTLTFSYWAEDFPNYCVMIGLAEGPYHPNTGAALDELVTLTDVQAKYWEWYFHNSDELRQVLIRIRDYVLPNYAAPLWQQPATLHQRLIQAREKWETKANTEKVTKTRALATVAFREQRFDQVISLYRQLSPLDLSLADQKRLDIALKRQIESGDTEK